MNKKIDKRFKPAIEELIKIYEKGEEGKNDDRCPLCAVATIIGNETEGGGTCKFCPHEIVEERWCLDGNEPYNLIPPKARIPRLESWLNDHMIEVITYKWNKKCTEIMVYLEKKRVGTIKGAFKEAPGGWQYFPKGEKEGGEMFKSIYLVKVSLEED